jgi:hypothetical protein
MRTILQDEDSTLEISDEGFDSPLVWLKLTINGGENKHEAEIEITLRDLMGALIGFDAKRSRSEDELEQS